MLWKVLQTNPKNLTILQNIWVCFWVKLYPCRGPPARYKFFILKGRKKSMPITNALEQHVGEILRSLMIPGTLHGHQYLVSAITLTTLDPSRILYITKDLYPDLAKQFGSTTSKVERSMRHSIKRCWSHGGREALDQVARIHLTQRPTNSEFIDLVANYIRKTI